MKLPPATTMERAGRLIGKLKFSPDIADPEARARAAWSVAAGKKIAAHTRAVALVRGSLIVEVEDYIWQQQLWTLRQFLIRNLEKTLGESLVTDLDFRPMLPARRAPLNETRRRMPQRAETAHPPSEGIEDPVLETLYRQSKKKARA